LCFLGFAFQTAAIALCVTLLEKKSHPCIAKSTERVSSRAAYKGLPVDTALWHYCNGHSLRISSALLSQGI
jgi:hypothetical protein